MKKQLYFDDSFQISKKLYILIVDGRIREYNGADFIPLILDGSTQPEFKLIKLSKYDQKKLNIKANYKVDCHYLLSKFLKDSYIKLNPIDKFRIDYYKKQSIFHKMNFNHKLISLVLLSLPLIYITTLIKSCENQSNRDIDQSKKPDLTTNNHAIINDNKKADSVSIQTIKFDLDSLFLK